MGEPKLLELYVDTTSDGSITQGDILFNFPVLVPVITNPTELTEYSPENIAKRTAFDIHYTDLIIMTQSCDLVNNPAMSRKPLDYVVCATIRRIDKYTKKVIDNVNSGRMPAYYLLNKDDKFLSNSQIIDFTGIHTITYEFLNDFASKQTSRFKPSSPILEKISHHFGNYFSRIGLDYEREQKDLVEEYRVLKDELKEKVKQ